VHLEILHSGIFDTDLQIPAMDSRRRWVDPPVVSRHHLVHVAAGVNAFLAIVLGIVVTTRRLQRAGRLHGQFGQRVFLAAVIAWLLLAARGFVKSVFVLEK
jgi:hypothetical protein